MNRHERGRGAQKRGERRERRGGDNRREGALQRMEQKVPPEVRGKGAAFFETDKEAVPFKEEEPSTKRIDTKESGIIVAVEGSRITPENTLASVLKNRNPGDTLAIIVFREGKEVETQGTVAEWEKKTEQPALARAASRVQRFNKSMISIGGGGIGGLLYGIVRLPAYIPKYGKIYDHSYKSTRAIFKKIEDWL